MSYTNCFANADAGVTLSVPIAHLYSAVHNINFSIISYRLIYIANKNSHPSASINVIETTVRVICLRY